MVHVTAKRQPFPAWIEAIVRLPRGVAADPGPIKLYPYQRGITIAIVPSTANHAHTSTHLTALNETFQSFAQGAPPQSRRQLGLIVVVA